MVSFGQLVSVLPITLQLLLLTQFVRIYSGASLISPFIHHWAENICFQFPRFPHIPEPKPQGPLFFSSPKSLSILTACQLLPLCQGRTSTLPRFYSAKNRWQESMDSRKKSITHSRANGRIVSMVALVSLPPSPLEQLTEFRGWLHMQVVLHSKSQRPSIFVLNKHASHFSEEVIRCIVVMLWSCDLLNCLDDQLQEQLWTR